jgi:hypothetical protein
LGVEDVLGLKVPDIVAIVGFEWTINVWFVLEKDSFFFFCCSWWRKRRFVVDDARLYVRIHSRETLRLNEL